MGDLGRSASPYPRRSPHVRRVVHANQLLAWALGTGRKAEVKPRVVASQVMPGAVLLGCNMCSRVAPQVYQTSDTGSAEA